MSHNSGYLASGNRTPKSQMLTDDGDLPIFYRFHMGSDNQRRSHLNDIEPLSRSGDGTGDEGPLRMPWYIFFPTSFYETPGSVRDAALCDMIPGSLYSSCFLLDTWGTAKTFIAIRILSDLKMVFLLEMSHNKACHKHILHDLMALKIEGTAPHNLTFTFGPNSSDSDGPFLVYHKGRKKVGATSP